MSSQDDISSVVDIIGHFYALYVIAIKLLQILLINLIFL